MLPLLIISSLIAASAFAAGGDTDPNCQKLVHACQKAGFVLGGADRGIGLYADCTDPIVRGGPQPKNAKKKLPKVDAKALAACKQKNPGWGEVGAKK